MSKQKAESGRSAGEEKPNQTPILSLLFLIIDINKTKTSVKHDRGFYDFLL